MGKRGTLVLALLVLASAAYLAYEGPPPGEQPKSSTLLGEPRLLDPTHTVPRLLDFKPEEITEVALERNGKAVIARRQNGHWTHTTPPGVIADFVETLTGLGELMRLDENPTELRDYGLDPPQGEIELRRRSGEPLVLLLGEHNPSATGAYVRIGRAGRVVLAGSLILWEFDRAYKALGG
jgi:Domain of unknown function (DUF4340)